MLSWSGEKPPGSFSYPRLIELYWAIVNQALRKHPKEVQSEKKWVFEQEKLQPDVVQKLMSWVKRKVWAYGYGIEVEWDRYSKSLLMGYIFCLECFGWPEKWFGRCMRWVVYPVSVFFNVCNVGAMKERVLLILARKSTSRIPEAIKRVWKRIWPSQAINRAGKRRWPKNWEWHNQISGILCKMISNWMDTKKHGYTVWLKSRWSLDSKDVGSCSRWLGMNVSWIGSS